MKAASKTAKAHGNRRTHSRLELLAAQERALEKTRRLNASEGFQTLVRAGICTSDGELTPRYGG